MNGKDFDIPIAGRDSSGLLFVRTFKIGSGIVNDVEYKNLTVNVTSGDPPVTEAVNVTKMEENERKSNGDWTV